LKQLKPLLDELNEFKESLDSGDFIDSCYNLYRDLDMGSRRLLLDFELKKQKPKPKDPFRPSLDRYSRKIAGKRPVMKIEDRLILADRNRVYKLDCEQLKEEMKDKQACPFVPTIKEVNFSRRQLISKYI
jgi:hypothetical protein